MGENNLTVLCNNVKFPINRTFYNSSVVQLSKSLLPGLPDEKFQFILTYRFLGGELQTHKCSVSNDGSYYKFSLGNIFISQINSKCFFATKAACFLNDDKEVSIGECILFSVAKNEETSTYYLFADNIHELDDNETVVIGGETYTASMLRKISRKLIPDYSGRKKVTKKDTDKILWDLPTDWIPYDSNNDSFVKSFSVYNAVYMWMAHYKNKPNGKKLVYVGIVGDDNNIANSVGRRMGQHVRDKGIEIECFRYSELVNAGKYDKAEVLKTVEMQCINMVSGLIKGRNEHLITPMLDGIIMKDSDGKDVQYEVMMPNEMVRFQQGYQRGDLKSEV